MGSTWLMVWIPNPQEECRIRNEAEFKERNLVIKTESGGEIVVTKIESPTQPLSQETNPAKGEELPEPTKLGIDNLGIVDELSPIAEVVTPESGEKPRMRNKKNLKLVVNNNVEQDTLDIMDSQSTKRHSVSSGAQWVEFDSLEDRVDMVLAALKIRHYTKQDARNGKYILFIFCVSDSRTETVLIRLQKHGVGNNEHTSISVIPSAIQVRGENVLEEAEEENEHAPLGKRMSTKSDRSEMSKLEVKVEKFYNSIKSRMLVAEVIGRIKSGGEFTFDYLMLLFLAGCIAFMGLIENSSVVLVASMLVSPLMGPILAGTFGTVIKDKKLRNLGINHELISLLICIIVGMVFGLIFAPWIETYGVKQWPTSEMLSRGQLRSLLSGVFIAVPSGAGVALSILGGNAGSLVGVAISASLLPPAVNCGLFWAISLISTINGSFLIGYALEDQNSTLPIYTFTYSEDPAIEAACLGIVSFALTIVNIICIIITGILILKLKEVTPEKIPQSFSKFWKVDVKTHRSYTQTVKRGNARDVFLEEARSAIDVDKDDTHGQAEIFLSGVLRKAQEESTRMNIREWVPQQPGWRQTNRDSSNLRKVSRINRRTLTDEVTFNKINATLNSLDNHFPSRRQCSVEEVSKPANTEEHDGSQSS
eukprot:snap_masked-scaffold1087_size63509-processed-gene-0.3 protein:Tk11013 transcript:snap_masked-scaffold1087_size63509-processed-gene-0.3-mRNA-1 annotation:"conserved hypothetical protein"